MIRSALISSIAALSLSAAAAMPAAAAGGHGGGYGGHAGGGGLGGFSRAGGSGRSGLGRSGGGAAGAEARPGRVYGPGNRDGDGGHHADGHHGDGGHHHRPPVILFPSYGFYGPGFGYGLGLGFYDPFYYEDYGYRRDRKEREKEYRENVQLDVSPKNTEVYVNGLLYRTNGKSRIDLPTGHWTIELRAPGYVPQTIDLNVEQGIKYQIRRALEKDRGQRDEDRDRRPEPDSPPDDERPDRT